MKKLIFLTLLLSGCLDSHLVQVSKPSQSLYAPLNESSLKKGTVKYLSGGWLESSRRENAYKKMHDYCGGNYRLTHERTVETTDTYTAINDGLVYSFPEHSIYLDFECCEK